jgi:16S rRNA (uracil1498-N3)-methyltransferase
MRHFYVDPATLTKPLVTLKGSEAHHIKNVLRLKPGDRIRLIDGTGNEYEAAIRTLAAEKVEIEIRNEFQAPETAVPRILVAQAFLKEKKMDDLVRKLSELGIAGWIPFFSQRSVPRPDKDRLVGRTHRWKRIAAEAAKQCRRRDMLRIYDALSFKEMLQFSQSCELKIVFWENETISLNGAPGLKGQGSLKKIMLVLGPEGGFTEQEIEMVRQDGFAMAGLGPRILRAETATVAACTLIQFLYGDMGPGVGQPV